MPKKTMFLQGSTYVFRWSAHLNFIHSYFLIFLQLLPIIYSKKIFSLLRYWALADVWQGSSNCRRPLMNVTLLLSTNYHQINLVVKPLKFEPWDVHLIAQIFRHEIFFVDAGYLSMFFFRNYIGRVYTDSLVHDEKALKFLVAIMGEV